MILLSENYKVMDIKETSFDKVPRASLQTEGSRIAVDYHADLCKIKVNDMVKVELCIDEQPVTQKNVYAMRGVVYKISENRRIEISCGGLLVFYEGALLDSLTVGAEVYFSMVRV